MKFRVRIASYIGAAAMLVSGIPCAHAHGGVSVENDTCIMTIGPYKAHFTGYQPAVRASQEFCEDIPVVAKSIIVLDFISQPLREMAVDFRIVRDVNNIGVSARYADLGSPADIEKATLTYRELKIFPRGSVDVEFEFDQAGKYIGIMRALDSNVDDGREYISVFPFSVGMVNWWARLKWIAASILVGFALMFWSYRSSRAAKIKE
ncbi:MAG: hypothetical protein ACI915_003024 [Gammaproteobacteria bacterium]|jgi:hypothetical protein